MVRGRQQRADGPEARVAAKLLEHIVGPAAASWRQLVVLHEHQHAPARHLRQAVVPVDLVEVVREHRGDERPARWRSFAADSRAFGDWHKAGVVSFCLPQW